MQGAGDGALCCTGDRMPYQREAMGITIPAPRQKHQGCLGGTEPDTRMGVSPERQEALALDPHTPWVADYGSGH